MNGQGGFKVHVVLAYDLGPPHRRKAGAYPYVAMENIWFDAFAFFHFNRQEIKKYRYTIVIYGEV